MTKVPPDIQRLLQATISEMAADDIPIIPEIQAILQQELSAQLPGALQKMANLAKAAAAAEITTNAIQALKQEIQTEINRTAQATPLAAFAEFGGRMHQQNAGRDVHRQNRIASARQLAGMSESDQDTGVQTAPNQSPATGGGIQDTGAGQPAGGTAPAEAQTEPAQQGKSGNGQPSSSGSPANSPESQSQPTVHPDAVPNADQEAAAEQAANDAAVNPDAKPTEATTPEAGATNPGGNTEDTVSEPGTVDLTPPPQPQSTAPTSSTTTQATAQTPDPAQNAGLTKRALLAATKKARDKIQGKFATGNFKDYQFILGVAIIKDILDLVGTAYGDPGITGAIINFFASIIIYVALYGQGETFRKRLIKKWLTRIVLPIIAEYIPIFNEFVPTYTVDIIVIYLDTKASQNKLLNSMNSLDNLAKKIKGMGPKNSARKMSGIRRQINDHSQAAEQ